KEFLVPADPIVTPDMKEAAKLRLASQWGDAPPIRGPAQPAPMPEEEPASLEPISESEPNLWRRGPPPFLFWIVGAVIVGSFLFICGGFLSSLRTQDGNGEKENGRIAKGETSGERNRIGDVTVRAVQAWIGSTAWYDAIGELHSNAGRDLTIKI